MPDYVGYWLECHNRNCGFPVRVPYSPLLSQKNGCMAVDGFPILFACPVCLEVKAYGKRDLRKVQFRFPDPYKRGKLVLYSARSGCAGARCSGEIAVFAVAASNMSIAALLQVWRTWKVSFRCNQKHRFRMRDPRTWWIQEEKALAGADF